MVAGKILLAGDFASLEPSPAFIMAYAIIGFAFQESYSQSNMALLLTGLARIFHELLSRDHETGNPLVADAACGAGLSGAERARIRWACHRATAGGWFPYLNGTSQGPTPEDARKDGHIRGSSKLFMKYPG
jgi:hypothetical protein